MTAERLREAAALMRERAEAATPGPWDTSHHPRHVYVDAEDGTEVAGTYYAHSGGQVSASADAAHIASWHPAVALAVADWLDATAGNADALGYPGDGQPGSPHHTANAVADAYLGGAS